MVLKLNSLAKIYPHISVTDRRHVQALAKLVNSGIPAVEVSQSDEEFMRQIIQQVEGIAFFHPETNRNFLEGNCISTTILHKSVQEALKILRVSETGCALSFEAMNGRKNAFTQIVHREKKHKGQEIFANSLNTFITHNVSNILIRARPPGWDRVETRNTRGSKTPTASDAHLRFRV